LESINKCLDVLERGCINIEPGDPFFREYSRIEAQPLDEKNLRLIKTVDSDKTLSFIDGGNNSILSGPNFEVQLTRAYFNLFKGEKRKDPKKIDNRIDFLTVVTTKMLSDEKIELKTNLIPFKEEHRKYLPDEKFLNFNSQDRTLTVRQARVTPKTVAGMARRFMEWRFAAIIIINELQEGDVIIRDGSLQTGITNESHYANIAYTAALKNKVIFSGFAKSSTLLTTTGNNLPTVIKKLGDSIHPVSSWYYYPIANVKNPDFMGEMFFTNLNPLSKTTYRYEIFREQMKDLDDKELNTIFSDLLRNSKDLSFPGYPYGLIDADKFAAVSARESEYYQTLLLSLAKNRNELNSLISAINSHDIINQLRRNV